MALCSVDQVVLAVAVVEDQAGVVQVVDEAAEVVVLVLDSALSVPPVASSLLHLVRVLVAHAVVDPVVKRNHSI